jgi:hypothetical protein
MWWNHRRGITDRRLLVESFILMEPYWTIGTGSTPFWMVFNTEASLKAVETYLQQRHFDDIYMMLFSHGVDSIGLTSINTWRRILAHAHRMGTFVGVDPSAYPRDFAVFVRYYYDLLNKLHTRYPPPASLMIKELDEFLGRNDHDYGVTWTTET